MLTEVDYRHVRFKTRAVEQRGKLQPLLRKIELPIER